MGGVNPGVRMEREPGLRGVRRVAFEASSGRFMAVSGIGHAVRIIHDAHRAENRKERVDTRHKRSERG